MYLAKRAILLSILACFAIACSDTTRFGIAPTEVNFGQKVSYNNKVDILWVVDNSNSMADAQANLAAQTADFFNALNSLNLDYRIAAITTDMRSMVNPPASNAQIQGRFIGNTKVITASTPNFHQAFAEMIQPGVFGSGNEQGLAALQMALSENMLSTMNQGFLREDALLAIIFVSDEDDASIGNYEDYVDFLDQLKPEFEFEQRAWVANFIGVLALDGACTTRNQFSDPGIQYMNLVNISGGANTSICTADLRAALTNVKARIIDILTVYYLEQAADVSTIRVYINNKLLPKDTENGWTYDEEVKAIRFHGEGIPPADSNINIAYQPTELK